MIITIANQKGGVGKTTTATALATMLQKRGFKTLLIDADQQCNSTDTYKAKVEGIETLYDVLLEEEPIAAQAAIQATQSGYIIAGDTLLREAETRLKNDISGRFRLQEALEELKDYDYIIIDTTPYMGELLYSALIAADKVLIPVTADRYSVQGLAQLSKTVSDIKKRFNNRLQIMGLLLTKYNRRTILAQDSREALESLAADLGTKLFDTTIRTSTKAQESQALRMPLIEYAPKSTTAQDYETFIDEALEKGDL